MGEDFVVRGGEGGVGAYLVVDPEEDANGEECQHDRDIRKSAQNEAESAFLDILRSEHALHHVLVGAVGRHGEECRTEDRREDGVGIFQHLPEGFAKGLRRLPACLEHGDLASIQHFIHFSKAAGDAVQDGEHRKNHRATHEAGLDEVGPDDGLDPSDGCVGRSDGCDEDDAPEVGPNRDFRAGEKVAPDHDKDHAAEVESNADSEHAAEEKNPARHVLRPRTEADGEVFVDALDFELEIRSDEKIRDDDAGEDRSNGQLGVGEAEGLVAFGRRAKKCRCAGLGGDDRGQDGPPRDFVPPEGEFLQGFVPASGIEADTDDYDEVGQDNKAVDEKGGVVCHGRRVLMSTTEFLPLASYF